jgi:uncharacterized membrane protein YciS (DUF1049 family)
MSCARAERAARVVAIVFAVAWATAWALFALSWVALP